MRKYSLILIGIHIFISSGCGSNEAKNETTKSSPPIEAQVTPTGVVVIPPNSAKLKHIRIAKVQMVAMPANEVLAPGKIEVNPNRISRITLPVAGRITQVMVKLGDSVVSGQPLVGVESAEANNLQSGYSQAITAITQAQASLVQVKSAQRKAQVDYDRATDLFEHNAIAKKELQAAENDLTQSKAAVDAANAAFEQAKALKEQAVVQLAMYGLKPGNYKQKVTLRAPLAGKVTEINIVAGEFRSDTATPVITIADLRKVWVVSDVPENELRLIRIAEEVLISLDAYPGENFRGRVARLSDMLDPKTRTVKVSIELDNSKGLFRPEMFGRIRHLESPRNTTALPAGAIIQDGSRSIVYVEISAGRFEPREVKVGNRSGDLIGITSGVTPDDRVVVDGAILLRQ